MSRDCAEVVRRIGYGSCRRCLAQSLQFSTKKWPFTIWNPRTSTRSEKLYFMQIFNWYSICSKPLFINIRTLATVHFTWKHKYMIDWRRGYLPFPCLYFLHRDWIVNAARRKYLGDNDVACSLLKRRRCGAQCILEFCLLYNFYVLRVSMRKPVFSAVGTLYCGLES